MHRMTRTAAAILFAFSAIGVAHAEATSAAIAAPAFSLEADVTRVMKTFDVPGIAIAVVKDGKVIATQGFGVRKLGAPAPVDGKTLFEIASNSKAFTATLLAMLVDEGKLAWDDPVTKHLPDFQMYDAYVTHEMTVRDLLTHRSGLGLGAGDLMWWPTTTFTSDEIIHNLRYIRPATSFRNSYAYDNLLYIVAGKIAAQKAGKSWGDTVRERILKPVGMTATTTSLAENAGNPNQANAHSKIDDKIAAVKSMPVANGVGAVGINTNAEDIARWMMVLLDDGKPSRQGRRARRCACSAPRKAARCGRRRRRSASASRSPRLAATKPNFSAYGLGFSLRDYKGMKLAMHSGALQGFYSEVLLVPEAKLGIAVLTNAESGGALKALQYRLLDQYLGAAPADWIGLVSDERKRGARQGAGTAEGRHHHARGEVAAVAGAGRL